VIATSPETARQAAGLVRFRYDEGPHRVILNTDSGEVYAPDVVNPTFPPGTTQGDVDQALRDAAVSLDVTYTTPMEHNNPMKPHTTVARWAGEDLRLYDSTQGLHGVRTMIAPIFGLDAEDEAEGSIGENPDTGQYTMSAYGAYFAEVWVDADTGEVRVPRMLGYFDAGRIINPRTAASQFRGAMAMGIGMALHEESIVDPRFGHVVNHDFAEYHIPTNADVGKVEVRWLDTVDEHTNPMGSEGIGEIGIVGSPAAIGNAVYHATGRRIRNLPITPDTLI
jgi:CO/xanthine dehydrogenase Mo-binding subunit